MKITASILAALLLAVLMPTLSRAEPGDCRKAELLYKMGKAANNTNQKIQLFRQSIRLCPSTAAYYHLALTFMKLNRFHQALQVLRDARRLDSTSHQCYCLMGDAYQQINRPIQAYFCYNLAWRLGKKPLYLQKYRDAKIALLQKGIQPGSLYHCLQESLQYRSKGHDTTPSIDVRIHFDFDKATLSPQGEKETQIVGRDLKKFFQVYSPRGITHGAASFTPPTAQALAPPTAQPRFQLVLTGNTDSVGTAAYNMALSRKRALRVKQFLVSQFHFREDAIVTKGKGKNEPLIKNAKNKSQHALNRRVEVALKDFE